MYGSEIGTVTAGRYAFLMYGQATGSPTVEGINTLMFPWADGGDVGFDTDNAYGVENMFGMGILQGHQITSTSQLIVVGEYNEPVNVDSSGDVVINMEAGFAEQYFE